MHLRVLPFAAVGLLLLGVQPALAAAATPSRSITPASVVAAEVPGPVLEYGGAGPVLSTPVRIVDTAAGLGGSAALGAGKVLVVQVAGKAKVPLAGAGSVLLTLSTSAPTAATALTAWPTGEARPAVTSLSAAAKQASSNALLVKLGTGGRVSLFNSASPVQVKVDVTGWVPETAAVHALKPARLLDTATSSGPVGPAGTVTVQVTGRAGVPAGAAAAAVTVTAVNPSAATKVLAYPSGGSVPTAPVLQAAAGRTVSSSTVVPLGADGRLLLRNAAGSVQLKVDVTAWLPSGPALTTLSPALLLDTATGLGAPKLPVGPAGVVDVAVLGRGGVPAAGVGGVLLALSASAATVATTVTGYPTGSPVPTATSLSTPAAGKVTTLLVAKVGTDGKITLRNTAGKVHLAAHVIGWTPEGGDERIRLQPYTSTRLAGPGDIVSVAAQGSQVVLAASADVPPVGGYLSGAPGPSGSSAVLGRVTSVTARTGGTKLVTLDTSIEVYDAFADIDLDYHGPASALPKPVQPAAGSRTGSAAAGETTSWLGGFGFGLADLGGFSCSGGVDPHTLLTTFDLGLQDLDVDLDYDLSERSLFFTMGGTGVMSATLTSPVSTSCSGSVDLPILVPVGPVVVSVKATTSVSISIDPHKPKGSTTFRATAPVTIGMQVNGTSGQNLSSASFDGTASGATGVSVTFSAGLTVGVGWRIVEGTANYSLALTAGPDRIHYGPRCVDVDLKPTISLGAAVDAFFRDIDITFAQFDGPTARLYDGPCISWEGTITQRIEGVQRQSWYAETYDRQFVVTLDGTQPAELYGETNLYQPYTWTSHNRNVTEFFSEDCASRWTARSFYQGAGVRDLASVPGILRFNAPPNTPAVDPNFFLAVSQRYPGYRTETYCDGRFNRHDDDTAYNHGGAGLLGDYTPYSPAIRGTAIRELDPAQPGWVVKTVYDLVAVEVQG